MNTKMDAQVEPVPSVTQSSMPLAPGPLAPVVVSRPGVQTTPLVFASPHSGRCYPTEFLAASRLDPLGLRRSEDSFVDDLIAARAAFGRTTL